ncbi:Uncharacterized protein TCM_024733 [Theobroma cacao]|uniref:Uncharacterized protein n=1 Tax=Theobroma cacao TaxID=3641 RepID=A0A061EXC4_THECC|nr:Uncharacterized protein TCM_024733 [Theobroma cacao]
MSCPRGCPPLVFLPKASTHLPRGWPPLVFRAAYNSLLIVSRDTWALTVAVTEIRACRLFLWGRGPPFCYLTPRQTNGTGPLTWNPVLLGWTTWRLTGVRGSHVSTLSDCGRWWDGWTRLGCPIQWQNMQIFSNL